MIWNWKCAAHDTDTNTHTHITLQTLTAKCFRMHFVLLNFPHKLSGYRDYCTCVNGISVENTTEHRIRGSKTRVGVVPLCVCLSQIFCVCVYHNSNSLCDIMHLFTSWLISKAFCLSTKHENQFAAWIVFLIFCFFVGSKYFQFQRILKNSLTWLFFLFLSSVDFRCQNDAVGIIRNNFSKATCAPSISCSRWWEIHFVWSNACANVNSCHFNALLRSVSEK